MNEKEEFIYDVVKRFHVVKGVEPAQASPFLTAILVAILKLALEKFVTTDCLSNLFERFFTRRALKKAAKIVQDEYESDVDYFETYFSDDLVTAVIDVKHSLTPAQVKKLLK